MGQPVAVVEKQSSRPGVVRFEANRSFSGMGHDTFRSRDDAVGPTPSAEIARRFFDTGKVSMVHVYGNVVTVDLRKGFTSAGLQQVLENLYIYYTPGFVLPTFDAPADDAAAGDGAVDAAAGTGPAAAVDAALSRVPADLLARSKAALERAKAKKVAERLTRSSAR